MISASFFLLGSPQFVNTKTHQIVQFKYAKLLLLLAYLALENKVHTREALANIFWPDCSEEDSRANLRRALFNLHEAFAAAGLPKSLLGSDRNTVCLSRECVWIDVLEFEKNIKPDSVAIIAPQAALYQGAFLDGTFPLDEDLADWVQNRRTRYAQKIISLLENIITLNAVEIDSDALKQSCYQLLAIDDVNELAYSTLIRMNMSIGNKIAAIRTYEAYRKVLHVQLGIEPSSEITDLLASVAQGSDPKGNFIFPSSPLPLKKRNRERRSVSAVLMKDNLPELGADLISEAQMMVSALQQWVKRIELLK